MGAPAENVSVYCADCLDLLRDLASDSVDAVVTDPPYGIAFMGKAWDYELPSVEVWVECLRVLKPGGHLLAFASTRTQHRMACRIEDGGFEIRDMIAWLYGSGFPKSLDVSKAIDKKLGGVREKVRIPASAVRNQKAAGGGRDGAAGASRPFIEAAMEAGYHEVDGAEPATAAAAAWQGWGTAIKPALEPVTVARKPLAGTVAANVLAHGCGALNIGACRVGDADTRQVGGRTALGLMNDDGWAPEAVLTGSAKGRWPANVVHDGSGEVVGCFPEAPGQQGDLRGHHRARVSPNGIFGEFGPAGDFSARLDGSRSTKRFFYEAKASRAEREGNSHPTVKPVALMRWLVRLVCRPGGVVLDPFMGSGTTGVAARMEGFRFIGCELSPEYFAIAERRIAFEVAEVDDVEESDGPVPEQLDLEALCAREVG